MVHGLHTAFDENQQEQIQNHYAIVCATELKNGSSAQELADILEKEVFLPQKCGECDLEGTQLCDHMIAEKKKLENNLISICHDGGRSIAGEQTGLIGILKEVKQLQFLDVYDPCHALNLVLKKGLLKEA